MKKLKITIEGMHCAACAANVERALKKISGVKEANISLMTKKGFIETSDNVSESEIKKAIERVGYKVTGIEVI
jgi:Cu+-exporting ATPase